MSKSKRKKNRSIRRAASPFVDLNISTLEQHRRGGSKLIPPLLQIPNMKPSSWADDHMPEMLWAVLLTGVMKRDHYLALFRQLAVQCKDWFVPDTDQLKLADDDHSFEIVVDQTKLSQVDEVDLYKFIDIIVKHPLGYAALRPLLLLDSLPGIQRWQQRLGTKPTSDDWNTLAHAVAGCLDHQSEASTDVRWFKAIVAIITGRMHFPSEVAETLEHLRVFPNQGDMRRVRPFIRSMEMMMRRNPASDWVKPFWKQCLVETRCIDPSDGRDYRLYDTQLDRHSIYETRMAVIERFNLCMTSERADARLDSAFGLVLYGLSVIEEVGMHRVHTRIVGLYALRSLAEQLITLKYLAHEDAANLWQSYRVYGAGQAKLAFLKAQVAQGDLPAFMDEAALHSIANEDIWQEFLSIDLGNWANSNLRKMSETSGTKDVYDKFYDWTSTFIHGSWAAVRDTNFVTCHNALHRLHRIPRLVHRMLPAIEPDAIYLVNQMIVALDSLYSKSGETLPALVLERSPAA